MNDKKRIIHLFPSPYISWIGSGTIISISYDEAVKMINEDKENKKLKFPPEAME